MISKLIDSFMLFIIIILILKFDKKNLESNFNSKKRIKLTKAIQI